MIEIGFLGTMRRILVRKIDGKTEIWGRRRGETGTEIVGWALEALFSLALVVNGLSYTSRTSQVQVAVIQSMSGQEEGIQV